MKITSLTEGIFGDAPTIDTEAGVIRGVKALGRESKNGRSYTDAALAECSRHYEGAQINLNHPGKKEATADRPFQEGIGWMKNVQIRADGIYGDLHYLKAHPNAPMLVEAAQRNPSRFGLSHNAEGSLVRRDGKNVVESVSRVHSIDIVQNPATNRGLFESEEPESKEKPVKTTLKQFIEAIDAKHAAKPVLVSLLEMDSVGPEMGAYDMPPAPEEAGEMDADAQAKAAFEAMVTAVVADDSMDLKAKLARIKDILSAQDKLMNPAAEEPAEETPAPEGDGMTTPTAESLAIKAREDAETLLEAAGIKHTPAQVKALAAMTAKADRVALIESWRPAPVEPAKKIQKPAFSKPLRESFDPDSEDNKPLAGKELLAALKR